MMQGNGTIKKIHLHLQRQISFENLQMSARRLPKSVDKTKISNEACRKLLQKIWEEKAPLLKQYAGHVIIRGSCSEQV